MIELVNTTDRDNNKFKCLVDDSVPLEKGRYDLSVGVHVIKEFDSGHEYYMTNVRTYICCCKAEYRKVLMIIQ